MNGVIGYLKDFNIVSVIVRLLIAVLCGGVVGYGRSKRERAAGFRIYILICMGSCMSVLIALYFYSMMSGSWAAVAGETGARVDVLRIPAQAIQGIGFLGAGLIIRAAHQQVKGLTTSTGLFAILCIGIATGFGFYELVIPAAVILQLLLNVFSGLEPAFKRKLRSITLTVEFNTFSDIDTISKVIAEQNATISDVEIERSQSEGGKPASALFVLEMSKKHHSHSEMLTSIAELPCVESVQELIS